MLDYFGVLIHSPLNFDLDCRIFNTFMWSFYMHVHVGDLALSLSSKGLFVEPAQNLTLQNSQGGCQASLACNSHLSVW